MKLNHDKVMQMRTAFTAQDIRDKIQGIDNDQFLARNFVHTNDQVAKWLLEQYESQILLATSNFSGFAKGLHTFFRNTAQRIKEKNAYRKFFEFSSYVYGALSIAVDDGLVVEVLYAYNNLLEQQSTYLAPKHRVVFGVTTDGKPLVTKELYPKFDWPVHELRLKYGDKLELDQTIRCYKKYGYEIQSPQDIASNTTNERIITNMIFHAIYYIDETNQDMLPEPYFLPASGVNIPLGPITLEEYQYRLKERRYLLPSRGVLGKYRNTGDVKEIFFREKFVGGNKIVLLCKIRFQNDRFLLAFYDNELSLGYTPWRDTSGEGLYHLPLMELILDSYLHLTQESVDESVSNLFVVTDGVGDVPEGKPAVQFLSRQPKHDPAQADAEYIPLDKSQYAAVISQIGPFIRRLPFGAKASEEAKARAMEFGILLGEGETFVRPHKKIVYRSSDA